MFFFFKFSGLHVICCSLQYMWVLYSLFVGLAGKNYSRDIFRVEGFPLHRPDWIDFLLGVVSFLVFPFNSYHLRLSH